MYARTGAAFLLALSLAVKPSTAQNAHTPVVLDKTFGTIPPPNESYAHDTAHVLIVSAVLLALCLAFVGISIKESYRWKSTVPAALTIGAATCVFPEAVDNYLANCYWSQSHNPRLLLLDLLGREFDLFVGIIWWSFGSVVGCCVLGALMRKASTGKLWTGLALAAFFDFVLEEVLLNYGGIYMYYGHQPLVLYKLFPVWWMFCNTSAVFLGISITYRYRDWFNGWRSVFVLPILPFCYIGAWTLAAMPTIYVIHADASPFVTHACGVLTCCIAVLQTSVMMDVILGRDPLAFQASGRSEVAKEYKQVPAIRKR